MGNLGAELCPQAEQLAARRPLSEHLATSWGDGVLVAQVLETLPVPRNALLLPLGVAPSIIFLAKIWFHHLL